MRQIGNLPAKSFDGAVADLKAYMVEHLEGVLASQYASANYAFA